jgi:hypothetical protein
VAARASIPFQVSRSRSAPGLGDSEQALNGLEKTYEVRSQWLNMLKVDKIYDSLRSDLRFIALLNKVGLDK